MGLFDVPYCPNAECPNKDKLKKGENCPQCGTPAQEFGVGAASNLFVAKNKPKHQQEIEQKIKTGSKEILISDQMSDEEIKQKITEDMMNLAMHEAGTGWMRLGTLLSGNSTDQILGAGLKAIIDQNKIIIRQNELLLRALTKR